MVTMTLIEFLRARYDDDERTYNYLNDMGEQGPYYFLLDDISIKRRIIDLHRPVRKRSTGSERGTVEDCQMCDHFPAQYPCATLRLLALPYANHHDYQQEWRP